MQVENLRTPSINARKILEIATNEDWRSSIIKYIDKGILLDKEIEKREIS